jgi:hypothetical protein
MEYKKPKGLKIKKVDTSKVKVAKPMKGQKVKSALTPPKAGLKIKRATMPVPSMSTGPGKATKSTKKPTKKKKATTGKIIYMKGGSSKVPSSDRIKEEIKTETMASDMVKMLRLKQRQKTNKKLKGMK